MPRPPSLQSLNAILDVDAARVAGWAPQALADAFLEGGARFVQLRAKSLSGQALLDLASDVAARAAGAGAALVINDRADIARLAGAAGVHVGQADLPPAAARSLVGPEGIVGLSTHSRAQIDSALAAPGLSYLAIGPVYSTMTKAGASAPVGLEGVRGAAARAQAAGIPLVAIGGVTRENARGVIEAGATCVAVIGDLLAGGNPAARVRALLAATS